MTVGANERIARVSAKPWRKRIVCPRMETVLLSSWSKTGHSPGRTITINDSPQANARDHRKMIRRIAAVLGRADDAGAEHFGGGFDKDVVNLFAFGAANRELIR